MAKPPKDPKDWKIELSEQAEAKMAEDPEAAKMIRELNSRMRQVLNDIDPDNGEAVAAALRSIGMEPVTDLDELARLEDVADEVKKKLGGKKS